MKILKIIAENLPLFNEVLEIDFIAESRVTAEEAHNLINIFDNYYLNRSLTFTGLNASGKTQTLNIIAFTLNMMQAKSINNTIQLKIDEKYDNVLCLEKDGKASLTVYFYNDNYEENKSIGRLCIDLGRTIDESDSILKYIIERENIKIKKITNIRSKKDLFDFESDKVRLIDEFDRDEEKYIALPKDISLINVLYNLKKIHKLFYIDMLSYTNINVMSGYGSIPQELISFLDPSIEYIDYDPTKEARDNDIKLKFKNQDNIIDINSWGKLANFLSSGTVKGINVFMGALITLINGGVFVLDELENHFNREIAWTFINLFLDRKINKNNAILVYSTHYSELLDNIDRTDSIYIVNKNNKIEVNKLSAELKRKDIRKSEQFIKGVLKYTAPKYKYISQFRNIVAGVVSNDYKELH